MALASFSREALARTVHLTALELPLRVLQQFRKSFSDHVWKGTKYILPAERAETKLLLLQEGIGTDLAGLPDSLRALAATHEIATRPYELHLSYDDMTVPEVLDRLLPPGLPRISAFESIGHIAHVNLKDGHLPYKAAIGEIIIDKNRSTIRTVVNKLSSIDNTFRNFSMELLAGVPDYMATVRESDCTFTLDYSRVYWNSRLGTEHARLCALFAAGDVIADMFAGVGPFAVPAARRGALVYANDLNPASVDALRANASANGVAARMTISCDDARAFARRLIATRVPFTHVVMNLPGDAISFLDVFTAGFPADWPRPLPRVHVYAFSAAEDYTTDVLARVADVLRRPVYHTSVHDVRLVAPRKRMCCVSFSLDESEPPVAVAAAGGAGAVDRVASRIARAAGKEGQSSGKKRARSQVDASDGSAAAAAAAAAAPAPAAAAAAAAGTAERGAAAAVCDGADESAEPQAKRPCV